MKNKKTTLSTKLIILLILVILLLSAFYVIKNIDDNTNKVSTFSIEDKTWIDDNKNGVININVLNNVPVFGIDGVGVFHTFLTDFETTTGLTLNKTATYESSDTDDNYSFKIKNKIDDNDLVFYTDNYTVFSNEVVSFKNSTFLNNKTIGILENDYENLNYYFNGLTFKTFKNITELTSYYDKTEFEDGEVKLDYILIPYMQNLDTILKNNYNIVYKVNDISIYYVLDLIKDNKELNAIFTKYFNYWNTSSKTKVYNEELLTKLKKASNITDADFKVIDSKTYVYGYTNNIPFDQSKNTGTVGVNSSYINDFAEFLGITIDKKEYNNYSDLNKAITSGQIDIYFNYYNVKTDKYNSIYSHLNEEYVVLKTSENNNSIKSELALTNEKLVMLKDTKLYTYFENKFETDIKTVNSINDFGDYAIEFIVVDKLRYNYYKNTIFKNYYAIYESSISDEYNFMVKAEFNNLYILFDKYIQTLNFDELNTKGFNTLFEHNIVSNSNNTILLIILVVVLILVAYIVLMINKKVKAKINLKTYDKIKYMDALTSLKNRNYLNTNMNKWDLNSVFPQSIIIIDLNNIKIINDTYGHEKGDAVIGYAANILINNQIENTDIIRTDGNEFLIYLVGYNEKQIVTYIRKLYKLFSALPHNYGASLGYSMRTDDLKTIEDTINEASIGMRNNKKLTKRN